MKVRPKKKIQPCPEEQLLIEHLTLLTPSPAYLKAHKLTLGQPLFSSQGAFYGLSFFIMEHLMAKEENKLLATFFPAYTSKDQAEYKLVFLRMIDKMRGDGRVTRDFECDRATIQGKGVARMLRLLAEFVLRKIVMQENQGQLYFPCLDPYLPPTDINSLYPLQLPSTSTPILLHHLNVQHTQLQGLQTVPPPTISNQVQLQLLEKLRLNRTFQEPNRALDRGVAVDRYREFSRVVGQVETLEDAGREVCVIERHGDCGDVGEALARWIRQIQVVDKHICFQKNQPLPDIPDLQPLIAKARVIKQRLMQMTKN